MTARITWALVLAFIAILLATIALGASLWAVSQSCVAVGEYTVQSESSRTVQLPNGVPTQLPPCMKEEQRAYVRQLTSHALDDAFLEYVKQQFLTWMRDPTSQPQRAQAGINKALTAYRWAIDAVAKVNFDEGCQPT
jgi:hypothetical protein